MTTTADDPIRAEVERVLTVLVDLTVRTPVRLATAVPRCVLRRAGRVAPLAEPARVVRSFVDLLGAGGTARGGVATGPDVSADASSAVAASARADTAAVTSSARVRVAAKVALAIEDYQSLAASQVVDRLPTLTRDELTAVRDFEDAHRGRRTILGRIDQLLT